VTGPPQTACATSQNRACKYYKLTSDNDWEAFRWTSNYQIISKVYLKKHSACLSAILVC